MAAYSVLLIYFHYSLIILLLSGIRCSSFILYVLRLGPGISHFFNDQWAVDLWISSSYALLLHFPILNPFGRRWKPTSGHPVYSLLLNCHASRCSHSAELGNKCINICTYVGIHIYNSTGVSISFCSYIIKP